jgi:hypothetical protein
MLAVILRQSVQWQMKVGMLLVVVVGRGKDSWMVAQKQVAVAAVGVDQPSLCPDQG